MEIITKIISWFIRTLCDICNFVSKKDKEAFVKHCLPIIRELSSMLKLERFDWFTKNVQTYKVHQDFLDIHDAVRQYKEAVVWTMNNKRIKKDIFFIIDTFNFFMDKMMERTELRNDWMIPVRSYNDVDFGKDNKESVKAFEEWWIECIHALNNYTFALNRLIKHINKFSDCLTEDYFKKCFTIDSKRGKLYKKLLPKNYKKKKKVQYNVSPDKFS